jgi:DNA-directed DNA polymerase III PolC
MSDLQFVHTHVHSEFSLLDGLSNIKKLVKRAKELNMPAVALTDHGTMFGVIDFYRAAQEVGVKPLIGVETYLAPRRMTDRDSVIDKKPNHLLLLAKNQQGYQNLLKIASLSQLEGYYYKPRIDWDTLQQYSEGLIATSGCLAARIPQLVSKGQDDEAREWVGKFQEVFGAENFYLELQQHDIPQIEVLNKWLVEYRRSGHSKVGLVATNDVHYILKEDFEAHDVLLCIQTGAALSMPKRKDHDGEDAKNTRMAMSDNSYYLNSAEEMWAIWGDIAPEAVHNSVKIAEMCDVNLDTKGYHLPVFPVPKGFSADTYLRHLCEIGLRWRYGDNALSDPVLTQRLDYELGIINNMGFDTYFLIVWDLTQYAAHADIWWNTRGSGAGSLVAYTLGITLVDPIQNNLLFERFLNPGRVTMPDIDIDFPDDRRGELIAYAALKYGEDKVASIITFGTMGAKAAIKDVARVMEVDLSKINKAVNLIPTEAKQKPIEEYVHLNPDLQKLYDEDPELQRVIDMAKKLQGVSRHSSVHAAGVIIADKPLDTYIPLSRVTGKDPSGGALKAVTQFEMETCESIGLLKVDFLGLSTLTIVRRACDLIERFHGIKYDLHNIPYRHDDPNLTEEQLRRLDEAFELMGRGETVGVFQLESTGMQSMLRDMRPNRFEHIVAGVSLYRPGPMDLIPTYNKRLHGQEEVTYLHPKLEPILKETYGIIVYQESIMQIAGELFSYALGDADQIRKAVSKKKEKELLKHKETFLANGPANGVDVETAERIFKDIEFFANYGFNKCLTYDTTIIDAQSGRLVKIGDLASGAERVEETLTCDLDTLCLKPGKITAVMENGVKPVYRLTTELGKEIEATANHPFYTAEGWKLLGEMCEGEKIAIRVFEPVPANIEIWQDRNPALTPQLSTQLLSVVENNFGEILFDRITGIEYVGEQPTYDLTIEGTHNFIANDILVHNSHATDYAMVTVQSAYLKSQYPEEYMMAMLSVHRDDATKIATFMGECRRMNIPILPPHVDYSALDFDIQVQENGKRGIRFGLAGIKNAGEAAMAHIVKAREEGEPFESIEDLCRRVDLRHVGKRAMESLIMVGALDKFGKRKQIHDALDRMMSFSASYHKDREIGRVSLFGDELNSGEMFGGLRDVGEFAPREMMKAEKELLGTYVTGRPTDKFRSALERLNTELIASLREEEGKLKHDKTTTIAGEIVNFRKTFTQKGEAMVILTIEDWHDSAGAIDVVCFPRMWAKVEEQIGSGDLPELQKGEVVKITGKVDARRDPPQILGESITQNFTVMDAVGSRQMYEATVPVWEAEAPVMANGHVNGYSNGASQVHSYEGRTAPEDWSPVADFEPFDEEEKPLPPRWIVASMKRTHQPERDQKRLMRLHGTLREYPGSDHFIILVEVDGKEYRLDFPNETTNSRSDDLWNKLHQLGDWVKFEVYDDL